MDEHFPDLLPVEQVLRESFEHIVRRFEVAGSESGGEAMPPVVSVLEFALVVTVLAAIEKRVRIALYSPECPAWHLGLNLISFVGHVRFDKLSNGLLEDEDWPRITEAIQKLRKSGIFIGETVPKTVPQGFDHLYVVRPPVP